MEMDRDARMTSAKFALEIDAILAAKRDALAERKQKTPLNAVRALASMQTRAQPFLRNVPAGDAPMLIGQIRYAPFEQTGSYDPVAQSIRYVKAGVKAIALFTDASVYDGGVDDLMFVARAAQPFNLPVISQDFVFDEYQIVEARAAGAAGLALDPSALDIDTLRALLSFTQRNRMTPILRVGSQAELDLALGLSPQVIALGPSPFTNAPPDVALLNHLRPQIPSHINVMFASAQATVEDVVAMDRARVDAIVLSEHLLANDLPRLNKLLERADSERRETRN
jgi:indole-3-glycerol phosphate synthase